MTSRAQRELERAWVAAHTAAEGLRLTLIVVDEPRPRPVQKVAELATDIADLVEVGGRCLQHELGNGAEDARGAIGFANERWLEATALIGQLMTPTRLLDLDEFVHRHGDQWQKWWPPVLASIEDLIPSVHETDVALAQCWRELAQRGHVDVGSATVGTLRVGQIPAAPETPRVDTRDTATRLTPVPAPPTTGEI